MAKISKSWGDTFAELPTGKVAADAMIGGGVGMGANYMSNNSSGDSGGYLQAGLIGGALGGVTRGVLSKARGETVVAAKSVSTSTTANGTPEPGTLSRFATAVKDKSVGLYGSSKAMVESIPLAIAQQKASIGEAARNSSQIFQNTMPKSAFSPIPTLSSRTTGTLDELSHSRANPTPVDSFLQGANYAPSNSKLGPFSGRPSRQARGGNGDDLSLDYLGNGQPSSSSVMDYRLPLSLVET